MVQTRDEKGFTALLAVAIGHVEAKRKERVSPPKKTQLKD